MEKQRENYKYNISQAQEKLNDTKIELIESKKELEKTTIYAPYNCQIV